MNRVYELVTQINENIKEIKNIYKEENLALSRCDLVQEDLLHYLERVSINDGFEAMEVTSAMHDNRLMRRMIKNKIKELNKLMCLIDGNKLESASNKMVKVISENEMGDTYKVKILTDLLGEYI